MEFRVGDVIRITGTVADLTHDGRTVVDFGKDVTRWLYAYDLDAELVSRKSAAQLAYEARAAHSNLHVRWDALTDFDRQGWELSAQAVLGTVQG